MSVRLEQEPIENRSAVTPLVEVVTGRVIVVGLILLVLSNAYINWGTLLLRASKLNKSYFPMGLFFPFFGLAGFLVGVVAAPFYFATAENGWREVLHDHIPSWIVLTNEDMAATWFYEGLPAGQAIPWGAWVVPLIWWGTLIGAIGLLLLCLMVILRKQWVEYERLEYPLARVGMYLAAEPDDPQGISNMVRQRSFHIAFWLGLMAVGWNVMSYFLPVIPQLPTTPTSGSWFRWLERAPTFWVQVSIYIIGFSYFARVEALFSFWVFFVLSGIEISVFDRLGVGSSVGQGGIEAVRSQSFGALCTLSLASLWMARGHLQAVFKKAWSGDVGIDDSEEVLSYRTAVIGLVVGLVYMGGWLHLAGLEFKVLVLYMFFALMAYIGLSRVVAEVGLPYANISDTAMNWTPIYLLGSRQVGATSLVSQGFIYALFATTRGFLGPPLAHTMKLTSGLFFRRNRLVGAIVLALLVGFLFSTLHTLYLGYAHGGYNQGAWSLVNGSRNNYQNAVTWIRNPKPPDVDRLTFTGSGVVLALLLTYLKYRFIWWPPAGGGPGVAGNVSS